MKSSKAWTNQLGNFAFWLLVAFVLWQRLPQWWSQRKLQGQIAPIIELTRADGVKDPQPWPRDRSVALVFWATWCAPCKLELSRVREAAEKKEIPADRVILISMGEERELVAQVSRERNYPFASFVDERGDAARYFNVAATPTVVLLDSKQEVSWIGTGVSPTLIWRLKSHLN